MIRADLRESTYVGVAAGSGVAVRVAQMLAARGSRLMLAGRDPAALAPLAAEVGGRVVTADAASFTDLERCVNDAAATTGRLDGIVNCAGSILLEPAHLTAEQELHDVLTGNLVSAFATARAASNVMRLAPGLVDTPISRGITSNDLARKASVAMHLLGRVGTADDIAEAVCWLLSPQSSWVTGQVVGIDGGLATLKTRGKAESRS